MCMKDNNSYNDFKETLRDFRKTMSGNKVMSSETISDPNKGKIHEMSMRDSLNIMRNLNEGPIERTITPNQQKKEEEKFNNSLQNNEVSVRYENLVVLDNGVFWGGTIDNQLQFVYTVTPDENTSGVEFNYLEGYNPQDPENNEVIKNVESYYDEFYKYWRENELQYQQNDQYKDITA